MKRVCTLKLAFLALVTPTQAGTIYPIPFQPTVPGAPSAPPGVPFAYTSALETPNYRATNYHTTEGSWAIGTTYDYQAGSCIGSCAGFVNTAPGSYSASYSSSVNLDGPPNADGLMVDQETYSATGTASPYSMSLSATMSAYLVSTSGLLLGAGDLVAASAGQRMPLTVKSCSSQDVCDSGSGYMLMTYDVTAPAVAFSPGAFTDGFWWGGWVAETWMPTLNPATSQYAFDEVDFSQPFASVQTIRVPFIFGQPTIVAINETVGIGWDVSCTGCGSSPLLAEASGSVDPSSTLTGVQVFDSSNNPVSNFQITDDLGEQFNSQGFVAPEPQTLPGVLAVVLLVVRWRARDLAKHLGPCNEGTGRTTADEAQGN